MRRTIIFVLLLLFIPIKVFASMPDISAGETHFDFSSGCYILKNNVQVIARGRTMTANEAKVQIMSQKVWANGDVTLKQEGYYFKCDSIYVQGKLKTVDVLGNVEFAQDDVISITSRVGQFSWGTKVANFYGDVKVNIADIEKLNFADGLNIDKDNVAGTYDHVQYNIREKIIILLEKNVDSIPKMEFPEPDPSEGQD